jgi:hypothetical protein
MGRLTNLEGKSRRRAIGYDHHNHIEVMRDYPAYKKSAIRYWERRRILYNLLLVPPALVGYMVTSSLIYVGDPHRTLHGLVLSMLVLCIVGANVCFSFAYALEFFFGSDDPASRWLQSGRRAALIVGVLLAILLALIGGRDIARMELYAQPAQID